jgi:anti-sigma factor RsiW
MKTTTFRDIERLSAHLDGKLSRADAARLERRLVSDRELAAALADLRQSRAVLRRTPQRRAPRNFTLTPKMAGIRPPVPRAVPALSWASAVAMLFFACTLGTNLIGQFSFGSAAPMMAAAPVGMGGGGGYGGGPAEDATAVPLAMDDAALTATPEAQTMLAPTMEGIGGAEGYNTPAPDTRAVQPLEDTAKQAEPVNPWPYVWLGLAAALIGSALLVRWGNVRAFRRKAAQKQK